MIDYDPHLWRSHLLDIKGSMVQQIFYRVLVCVVWAALVVWVDRILIPLAISDRAHVLIGVALGLLLVFRTNASYDRFWEGRRMWGGIINESRNLLRSGSLWFAKAPDLLRHLAGWTIAFAWASMHALRGNKGLGPAVEWLPPAEVEEAVKGKNPPVLVARRMAEQLVKAQQRGLISDHVLMMLDQNIQLLVDYYGACERIHKTPLPFAYVVHLRRALIFYCATLPFALVRDFGWWSVLVTLFVSYIMLGIEEIGVEIEDPFAGDDNDLPLERFCRTIERDLTELVPDLVPVSDPAARAKSRQGEK